MFNLGLSFMGRVRGLTSAILYDFTPPWSATFTEQTRDDNGFMLLTPSVDTRITYVDSVGGNDASALTYNYDAFTDPFSPAGVEAFQDINVAKEQLRSGFPDWLLVKGGQDYFLTAPIDPVSGASDDSRSVYCGYGSTLRPVLKMETGGAAFRINNAKRFFNIIGFEVDPYKRRVTSPDYAGWGLVGGANAVVIQGEPDVTLCHSFTIEDNFFHDCNVAINSSLTFKPSDDDLGQHNIVIRRNIITDSYAQGRCQGMIVSYASMLVQENFFHQNGWLAHKYVQDSVADPTLDQLTVPLTGASETQVTVGSLDIYTPEAAELAITLDDASTLYLPYTSRDLTTNTYTISPTDFSLVNASVGNKAIMPWTQATAENHSSYCSGSRRAWFDANLSFSPSSMHFKFTADPKKTGNQTSTLAVSLTGASETLVVVNDLAEAEAIAAADNILITTDSTAILTIAYTSFDGVDTFTIPSTDFSADNASADNGAVLETLYNHELMYDVALTNNYMYDGELGTSMGGNDSNGNGFRFRNTSFQGNVNDGLGRANNTNRGVAWQSELKDTDTSIASHNLNIHTGNPAVNNRSTVGITNYANNVEVSFNKSYLAGAESTGGFEVNQSNNSVYANPYQLTAGDFIDPSRSIDTYVTTLGLATVEEFVTECKLQSRYNWRNEYTAKAVNDYIKAGFRLVSPIILSDLSDVSAYAGDTVSYSVDYASNDPLDVAWFRNGTMIDGETSLNYSFAMADINDGDEITFTLSENSTVVATSQVSTVTLIELTYRVAFNNLLYFEVTHETALLENDVVGFKYKTTSDMSGEVSGSAVAASGRVALQFGFNRVYFTDAEAEVKIDNVAVVSGQNISYTFDGAEHLITYTMRAGSSKDFIYINNRSLSDPFNTGTIYDLYIDRTANGGVVTLYKMDTPFDDASPAADDSGLGKEMIGHSLTLSDWGLV